LLSLKHSFESIGLPHWPHKVHSAQELATILAADCIPEPTLVSPRRVHPCVPKG
jgi:hypothetical protein